MTENDFQNKYHEYKTTDLMKAKIERLKLKVTDEGGKVVPIYVVKLDGEYCLMLGSAVKALEGTGIIDEANGVF
jgi:hypothetical protein